MTSREIIKTLLAKELPERVGLIEHFWGYMYESGWGEQGLPKDVDYNQYFNLDRTHILWLRAPGPRPDLVSDSLEETDEWKVARDAWGATTKHWKNRAGTPEHCGYTLTSPEIWYNEFRDAFKALNMRDFIDIPGTQKLYKEAMAGDKFACYGNTGPFEDLRWALGDLVMLESLLMEPEWITDFCTLTTDKYIEYYDIVFREIGLPDGMYIPEDLGYTKAPFASPEVHRELILPHHKRLFGFFKDYKLPIQMHTCGNFVPHIPAILEAGVDCIESIEAKTGISVLDLAAQYKDKVCLMGNINVQVLETGDRDKIKDEVLTKLNGMRAMRAPYIFMSDHSIPPSVKLSDYEYMLDLFWKNCRY